MKVYYKKYCDLCGDKLGLRGCYKLLDGNMCKTCARQVSPLFTNYPETYVADMQAHLDYRIGNSEALEMFEPSKIVGTHATLFIDEATQSWCFCPTPNYKKFQPDILQYAQILDCTVTIKEEQAELFRTDAVAVYERYNPPRYHTLYSFVVTVSVNCTWFSSISYTINKNEITALSGDHYNQAKKEANEIETAFLSMMAQAEESKAAADNTPVLMICPNCHAEVFPNEFGCCPCCGSFI